jgi:hypothetical protein
MIRLLLLAFPRGWRQRYGAELRDLIDDVGLSPATAADILRTGLAQRVRGAPGLEGAHPMVIGPAWRHPTGWAVAAALVLVPTGLFVAGSTLAYGIGVPMARDVMDPLTAALDRLRAADVILVLAPLVALVAAAAPLLRLDLRRDVASPHALVAIRLLRANLAVMAASLAVIAALGWYFIGEVVLASGA